MCRDVEFDSLLERLHYNIVLSFIWENGHLHLLQVRCLSWREGLFWVYRSSFWGGLGSLGVFISIFFDSCRLGEYASRLRGVFFDFLFFFDSSLFRFRNFKGRSLHSHRSSSLGFLCCYPFLWVNTFDRPTVIGIKGCGT